MTGKPSVAIFCAMPLPMLPAPTTPSVRNERVAIVTPAWWVGPTV